MAQPLASPLTRAGSTTSGPVLQGQQPLGGPLGSAGSRECNLGLVTCGARQVLSYWVHTAVVLLSGWESPGGPWNLFSAHFSASFLEETFAAQETRRLASREFLHIHLPCS